MWWRVALRDAGGHWVRGWTGRSWSAMANDAGGTPDAGGRL